MNGNRRKKYRIDMKELRIWSKEHIIKRNGQKRDRKEEKRYEWGKERKE